MSDGPRLPRAQALELARQVVDLLRPVCERVEIAGSLRRCKPDVGDIEIVCIPSVSYLTDLSGEKTEVHSPTQIYAAMRDGGFTCTEGGDRLAKFAGGACPIEIYITTPERWGVIFTIRTGPADWTKLLVTQRSKGGLCPSHLQFEGGRIVHRQSKVALETPEEADVFVAINHRWIAPEDRK